MKSTTPVVSPSPNPAPGFARRLGLFDMTMLVMGSVIGVGIFKTPHDVAALAGGPLLVLGAWALGGCVALAGSLVYAELTRRRPNVGGQYAYLREAYHPAVAFVYGWSLLWIIQSGGMASVAVVFSDYFIELMRFLGDWLWQNGNPGAVIDISSAGQDTVANAVVKIAAIGTLTLINCAGVRAAGTTQNVFMALKILAIVTLVFCGLSFAKSSWSLAETLPAALDDGAREGGRHHWALFTALGAALVPVFFSYGGWHTTTFVGEEVRDPRRTLSRALILGVSGVMALYLAVSYVCLRVLGVEKLAAAKNPAWDVMNLALGKPGAVMISIGIAISALGFLSQATLTSPRVYYAMAKDRLFFRSVAWIHPRTRVPVIAILLQGLFATVIALSGTFRQIVYYIVPVEIIFWSLTALGLFVIRRRDSAEPNSASLSVPGHPVTTLLFVAVNLGVLGLQFYQAPLNTAIAVGLALAGVPVYFCWRIWGGKQGIPTPTPHEAI
jgi:APA family basic amino acid/polyamine antiporter